MYNKDLLTFISSVMNENLAEAKTILHEELNKKLASILDEKFDQYAGTIYEKWDAEKADKNHDGDISDWEKASTTWAEDSDDETEGEESDEEEEESASEDEDSEEDSEDQ